MSRKNTYTEQLDQLLDACLQELLDMPAEDVLAGETAEAVKARAVDRLNRAAAEAGGRRLAAARARVQAHTSTAQPAILRISASDARAYIYRAVQDRQHTLAARNLDEMSDEDVLRIYSQMIELKGERSADDDDPGAAS
jgi:hypothetical protein